MYVIIKQDEKRGENLTLGNANVNGHSIEAETVDNDFDVLFIKNLAIHLHSPSGIPYVDNLDRNTLSQTLSRVFAPRPCSSRPQF